MSMGTIVPRVKSTDAQMSTIGNRLEEERKRIGHNQTQFGDIGGVGRKSQGLYERDERSPDAEYLAAIADQGADVLYIVTGKRLDEAGQYQPGHAGDRKVFMINESADSEYATAKSDRLYSPLDDLGLLQAVIKAVEISRPDLDPDTKSKLIPLLCEWARAKYGDTEEPPKIEADNVIHFAKVLGQ